MDSIIKHSSWIISAEPGTVSKSLEEVVIKIKNSGPQKGDIIYLYKEEDASSGAGIYAVCEVTGCNTETINLRINPQVLSNKRQFLKETTLLRDPGLNIDKELLSTKSHAIKLKYVEAIRLELLAKKTGKDFDAIDAMRCLLAYEECIQNNLNIDTSTPVKRAALETGRLLSSVSFKLANFRSLDPRTESAGFDGVAEIDQVTWNKYYDKSSGHINIQQLRLDLSEKEFLDPNFFVISPTENEEDKTALRDDQDLRQFYARRIRRGQSRFRKALLTLYNNQCAFTGVTEDRVLEACHILPHAWTGNNQLDNGLILRADLHTLFDLRLATVANDGLTIRLDTGRVTSPEYTRLNMVQQHRAVITTGHREILSIRNREISWLN
jgi:hypothetical protein